MPAQDQSCRVYVGNLSWKVRWQDLKDHMKQAGEVVRADVFEDFNGRSKGCGIVEYSAPEEAQRAIKELNDSELFERLIFVREDREDGMSRGGGFRGGRGSYPPFRGRGGGGYGPRGGGGNGRQVFVSNLPWRMSWQDMKDLFRGCGEVVRADIMMAPDGRSKGVGTVLFASEDAAHKAVDTYNNYEIDGRRIGVKIDRQ